MRQICFLLFVAAGSCFAAEDKPACSFGEGFVTREVVGFEIKIAPYGDTENPSLPQCRATIRDVDGKIVFSGHDSGFDIVLAGEDVNGDGVPDVVLEAYSGGAHCCWSYFVVSLGPQPGTLARFENQRPAKFARNPMTGRIEISTWDGAFDYFDGTCHPCSPMPKVFLRLDGKKLSDISAEHGDDYDKVIDENRKALTAADLLRLRALKENPSETAAGMGQTVTSALTIVVSYLYSGREQQAHQALTEMWPATDQERMWELILETRRNGLLRITRRRAAGS